MPQPSRDQACFYADDNFQGRSFCVNPGSVITNLADYSGVNDKFSSAIIPRGFSVTVYEHKDFGGQSLTLTGDVPSLTVYGRFWNDVISSIDYRN
jgi:Beta/Gamma crystallin